MGGEVPLLGGAGTTALLRAPTSAPASWLHGTARRHLAYARVAAHPATDRDRRRAGLPACIDTREEPAP